MIFLRTKLALILLISAVVVTNLYCKKSNGEEDSVLSSTTKEQASLQKNTNPAEFVVDQSNVVLTNRFSYNNFHLAPMGQEFTPSLYALDAIELILDDASCALNGSPGGDLQLNLREGTITGRILATTEASHFPNCFYGVLRFNFPAVVAVTPGRTYVMEAVHVSGHSSALYMNESPDNYTGGNFIMMGTVRPGKDLWFREGLFNFIARTKEQVREVGWQNLVRRDGTPFKNQGDCMKYINTGR